MSRHRMPKPLLPSDCISVFCQRITGKFLCRSFIVRFLNRIVRAVRFSFPAAMMFAWTGSACGLCNFETHKG